MADFADAIAGDKFALLDQLFSSAVAQDDQIGGFAGRNAFPCFDATE
ncbi:MULTISPECIES: hypothetical protein [unclassified Bradyrhizobium]|nr:MULTISPECIES: hypothetical protein [unclassified Bradyrhizobium]MCK1714249.1 hypothetical protein [Bradyrhizobium sp. 143]MCK1730965.1 hypothetical protein [Bradyrhizobium sp. 142]